VTLTGYNAPQPTPAGDGELVSPKAQKLVLWHGSHCDTTERAVLICDDLQQRIDWGTNKYGTPLKTHNGRSAKVDGYQEVLDAIHYCQQDLMENNSDETYADLWGLVKIAFRMRARLDAQP
jgi:hypothetical protein